MILNGCTIAGNIYARKLLVRWRFLMVIYQGISPALKYMVMIVKRYQNFLAHIFCWVNINPR